MAPPDLLVFVRHARPEVDPAVPPAEWTLGVEGMVGAERLAARLAHAGIRRIVASVEPKARDTARLVAEQLDVSWQTGHDLHEHVRSASDFLDRPVFEAAIKRLFAEPSRTVFGQESGDAAAARFEASVDALCKAHRGQRLAIVTHGTVLSLHLERRYGLDGFSTWQRLGLPAYVVVERRLKEIVDLVVQV